MTCLAVIGENAAWRLIVAIFFSVLVSCEEAKEAGHPAQEAATLAIPTGFPEMNFPDDNPHDLDRAELGRQLFFDVKLSLDSTKSCASCHLPDRAFTDPAAFSEGVGGQVAERNSPTLMNIGFAPHLMAEGGVPNLELQVLSPIENPVEMNIPIAALCDRMNKDDAYKAAFQRVFGTDVTPYGITRAIAAYERTLIGGDAPFDAYMQDPDNGHQHTLDSLQLAGWSLFRSDRLQCVACHTPPMFTTYGFANNGLAVEYRDRGRGRLTLRPEDEATFKIPTLRNIALTSPYMHDGSFATLDEVLDHYAAGGQPHPNKHALISGFTLTQEEREALLAFLESLTEASARDGRLAQPLR